MYTRGLELENIGPFLQKTIDALTGQITIAEALQTKTAAAVATYEANGEETQAEYDEIVALYERFDNKGNDVDYNINVAHFISDKFSDRGDQGNK